ncbi:putative ABC transport system permease protein [Streptomyces sp. TLI_053]|uniref:FtsX-like permease family protein n=1 Tax=Streptomyces sp. TLI_053 TaxID=1855352 RepID=UPI00087D4879|nr:FtsX-like permease family protein [Streptomyces sp. TLI_053]SDT73134.1 putative ABC transport system permease protein [Streptomyces sp. TLI_053]
MKLSALRVALRIARRDALRSKGRSALVIAMVALPVLGVTGADIVHRSGSLTPAERVERLMGGADALVTAHRPGRSVEQAPFAEDGVRVLPEARTDPASAPAAAGAATSAELLGGLLPSAAVLVPATPGPEVSTSTREGLFTTSTAEADPADRVWSGRLDLVEGRAPAAPDEAAVTRAFLDEAGLRLGDSTTVKGLERTPFRLTGVVEHPGDLGKVELVARPGRLISPLAAAAAAAPDAPGGPVAAGRDEGVRAEQWLVRLPVGAGLDWTAVQKLNRYGFTVTSRAVALDPPPASAVPYDADRWVSPGSDNRTVVLVTVIGMALLEVTLLAGPAFAVGARRSRRQLALVGAAGGHRGHIRAIVLGGGLVLGLAGAALGVALGTGLVAALRPWLEGAGGSRFGHFAIAPLDLLAIAAVGVLTALAAAVLPAVQAARRDVVAGLTGRDSVATPGRLLPVVGLLLVGAGAALALYGAGTYQSGTMPVLGGLNKRALSVLAGAATAEVGILFFTPMLIALFGRLAGRLPLGPRLALRDSARHRGRTAPAVAAVMAAVAGAVAVGVYSTGTEAQERASYRPTAPTGAVVLDAPASPGSPETVRLRRAVEQALPDLGTRADVQDVTYVFCDNCSSTVQAKGAGARPEFGNAGSRVLSGDTTVLHHLFGVRDRAAEEALAAGRAVVFDRAFLNDGRATLTMQGAAGGPVLPGQVPGTERIEVRVEAVLAENPDAARYGAVLMGPEAVRRAGLTPRPNGSVWRPEVAPDRKAQQRAEAAVARLVPHAQLTVERGYRPKGDMNTLALGGFAVVVVLGAAAVATGLAAADSRNDRATLAAVGAPPRTNRIQAGLQCTLIAGVGAVLGTVSGFVPALGLLRSHASGQLGAPAVPFTAPWGLLLLIVVVLPVVAGLGAAAFGRGRLPLARRAG